MGWFGEVFIYVGWFEVASGMCCRDVRVPINLTRQSSMREMMTCAFAVNLLICTETCS